VFSLRAIPDAPPVDAPPMCPPGIGHDEDGDCIPDTTDKCPGIPDETQPDGDGDRIGDDCDPDPAVPGNMNTLFVTFEAPSEQGSWNSIGAWSVAGDDYTNTDMTPFREDWTYRNVSEYAVLDEIEARITVGPLGTDDVKVGVGFYASGATPTEWSCSLRRIANQAPKVEAYANQSPSFESPLSPATVFGDNQTYTFRMKVDGTSLHCDVRGEGGDTGQATATFTTFAPGYVGVFTTQAGAHVHYIAVYTVKPPTAVSP